MRIFLYVSIGILAALLGITISGKTINSIADTNFLAKNPEFLLFPLTSSLIALATVLAESLLNNPTHFKTSRENLPKPLTYAFIFGIAGGLVAAVISWLFQANYTWPEKMLGWIAIGISAGIADGFSWRYRTIEGTQKEIANQRQWASIGFGAGAGFLAFLIWILVDRSLWKQAGDLLGLVILGGCLGWLFAIAGMGIFSYALRAGKGFEAERYRDDQSGFPRIKKPPLRLNCLSPSASEYKGLEDKIEEGMSIELPKKDKITLGSDADSDIFVSELPRKCATITLDNYQAFVEAHCNHCVSLGTKQLIVGREEQIFHNQLLTLLVQSNSQQANNPSDIKYVRFIFYDRFLDAQG